MFLLVLSAALTSAYITNIEVDSQSGQIYVTEDNVLYELDDVLVVQNAVHYTPGDIEFSGLHVGKSGNKRALFSYIDTGTDSNEFGYFTLPLNNRRTLEAKKTLELASYQSNPSTYDDTDRVAILSVSRNLTLVDLNTVTISDTTRYYETRMTGTNLIYNHQNNHLIIFYTYLSLNPAGWGLDADEFDLSTNSLVEVDSTFNCQCDPELGYNATLSPFLYVILPEGSCDIDYSSSPARIYCPYPDTQVLFSFNAANLADWTVISIDTPFDAVAFDFAGKHAYAIYANGDDLTTRSFSVSKVNLRTGEVSSTYFNNQYIIDATVFALDIDANHLYLSIYSESAISLPQIISLNVNTMRTAEVATLSTLGL